MKVETILVDSHAGVAIPNKLYQPEQRNNRLLALIPGRGYLVSHTHLHLTHMLGLQLGYDVLATEYGFQVARTDIELQHIPQLKTETEAALREALSQKSYDEVILVGKSLGTPIAAQLANDLAEVSRTILLTPISGSTEIIASTPTLAIIGTADGSYDAEKAQNTEWVRWKVYDGLAHSLLLRDNIHGSIPILADILREIETFLTV